MQHLDIERIAAFDHEAPSLDELAHLAACRFCRAERTAMLELSQLAVHVVSEPVASMAPRLTSWDSLSGRLRAEGLITATAVPAGDTWVSRARPRNRTEWWRAAAAALLLLAGGGALGRVSAGAPVMPGDVASNDRSEASVPGFSLGSTAFSSAGEANRALNRAQREYERASLWLVANDPGAKTSDVVRRRLAALDQMIAASRAGLEDAPNDLVLNHYYSAALAMRETTLQQLDVALPVGRSIERF
jgi:hypothetical protein